MKKIILYEYDKRNREDFLKQLEDAGYVSVVGKESRVSLGRPGRIIKIHFAE